VGYYVTLTVDVTLALSYDVEAPPETPPGPPPDEGKREVPIVAASETVS
jgi:hypothetical protein